MNIATQLTRMNTISNLSIARLLQLTDSACPIGTFTFSCGLESAAACGLVHDSQSLKEFARANAIQSATCDGIAALHAYRATLADDYPNILEVDNSLIMAKMNEEARSMLCKMGKKLAELCNTLIDSPILRRFIEDIKGNKTFGTFPIAQGIVFARLGIGEEELFYSHQYGVINMVLSAALRCVRVSHIDTQKILFELMSDAHDTYSLVKELSLSEMNAFCPEMDIMASIHEKGSQRMFMS